MVDILSISSRLFIFMNSLSNLLFWQSVAVTTLVYFVSLAFYRLFLHPLAKFPGPKLAAITRYYEAYYDIIQNGQYTFKIVEMHKEYGPIIRISPYELHIIDPTFFEKLYCHDGVWHKYAWAYDAFSAYGATICSASHQLHKSRRRPLNAFFSNARVGSRQELIQRNVCKLCDRLTRSAMSKSIVDVGAAISALTRDISTEFILGRTYNSLDQEDFDVGMTNVFQDSGHIWRVTKHLRFFGPTMKALPVDWVMKVADEGTKAFFAYLKQSTQDTEALMGAADASSAQSGAEKHGSPTIVHEILKSNLPPADKTFSRVFDDVATTTGAGFETTASVLRLTLYHVFSDADILSRLRAEVHSLQTGTDQSSFVEPNLNALERLPYLTSVLMEGMRLSPAIASRMARIAPDRDLFYKEWRIPANTPVGMTTLLMHMNETLYPDPMRFNPDRWMAMEVRKSSEKTYAPFSRGTRICLGMQ
jgi:cytochrome P450